MIEVIPAIDIIGGKCVRLSKGDYASEKIYGAPEDMARAFADAGAGRIHLVDLDGAKASSPVNLATLERIASIGLMKIEWGGGIKSPEALGQVFDAGADYAIVGSIAATEPQLFKGWLEEFGPDRMILGADVRDGRIAVKGWQEESEYGLADLLEEFGRYGLRQVVCTDISRDGMLCGPALSLYEGLSGKFPEMEFTVSGGISGAGDIRDVEALGLPRVIVGKAFYEGHISIDELKQWWRNA